MNRLEVKNVKKQFGGTQALAGVSLAFEEGHIYGLLGRNGAGKSTLLNLITARLPADEGEILINGEPVWENDRALSKMYCMSEPTYYPESMRVGDVMKWSASFYPNFSPERAGALCEAFELGQRTKIKALSTGYDSICKIVVALSCGAEFILLDEPILGLDAYARELFYRELLNSFSINPGAYVISTHLISEVSGLIERAVIIKRGKVLLDDEVEAILSRGYSVSGPAALVDAYCAGKQVIGRDMLGGFASACILGQRASAPQGLEVSGMDLQHLFVKLTEPERGVENEAV